MLTTPKTETKPKTDTIISFIDESGQYRQRSYDLFDESHRAKIIKTLQYAKAQNFELRIRFK